MGTRIESVRGGTGKASSLYADGFTGFPTDIRGLKTAELTLDVRAAQVAETKLSERFYLVRTVPADGYAASLFCFTTVAVKQDVVPIPLGQLCRGRRSDVRPYPVATSSL